MSRSYQVNTVSSVAGQTSESVYTQADLDKVDKQILLIAQGKSVSEYEVAGRKLKFRDNPLAEMQALRKLIERTINASKGGKKPLRYSTVVTSKGL